MPTGEPVGITGEFPVDWELSGDPAGTLTFTIPSVYDCRPRIEAIRAEGSTDEERVRWAAEQEFGGDVPDAPSPGGGRLWAVRGFRRCMFIPAPSGVVVVCTAAGREADMPEITAAFHTVRIG